jgi:hypothetical protein
MKRTREAALVELVGSGCITSLTEIGVSHQVNYFHLHGDDFIGGRVTISSILKLPNSVLH